MLIFLYELFTALQTVIFEFFTLLKRETYHGCKNYPHYLSLITSHIPTFFTVHKCLLALEIVV